METYNDESLNRLFSEITPEEQAKTDAKMLLAVKIADAMKAKNWNKKQLMKEMGKTNPSEITRWLSGTQNFTVETLVDLERVLDIKLLQLKDNKPTIKTIQQYKIDILVPLTRNEQHTACFLSEPDESVSYYKQIVYS
jgi:transcriptional regulator with XRE-family HTH domain